ncbi:hypothetical protein [Hydrogenophaga sp. PBL-H3]|uniref:hypothetical protein n=1 Tax=Hydrogenophaga sp. PBL-H3 TaxID=434010 RepID=UPI00131FE58B|nr:hypothetical protein [Hydrogenophaga sp. PBL-H3]QHE76775.1 hypothetical protein F9Z45_12255 [Hydrogenophaga sp. PBL-H3]QHE81199.1 hypothetical protein F9Z44_12255 [Hydrogenophaga sp. PBL-H3]
MLVKYCYSDMINALRVFFVFLLLMVGITQCIQGNDQERNAISIGSTGECTLSEVIAQTGSFQRHENLPYDFCIMYAAPGSYREIGSSNCILATYNLEGRITPYKFEVGKRWFVLPIWRDEKACSVLIARSKWSKLNSIIYSPLINKEKILGAATTIDDSSKGEDSYRILYNEADVSEQSIRPILLNAVDEAIARGEIYDRSSDIKIEIFTFERRLKRDSDPICYASFPVQSRKLGGEPYIGCNRAQLEMWQSREKLMFNFSPEARKEIFTDLANLSQPYTKKSYTNPSPIERRLHLLSLNSGTARINDLMMNMIAREIKTDRKALNYILDEGYTLGWAFPMADAIQDK